MDPIVNKPISPALLLPAILNAVINGTGRSSTVASSNILLIAWPRNMGKNSSGFLVPQPIHLPGRFMCQFFAMGRHGKTASRMKVKPQTEQIAIISQVRRLASRYTLVFVVGVASANRRRYWKRMDSLIRVALAEYAALVE
jgi:hypothetical protein